jgi:hypothetical protein
MRTEAGGAAGAVGGELGGVAFAVVDEADGGAVGASGDDAQGAEARGAVEGLGDLRTGCVEVGQGLAPDEVLVADEVVEGVELPHVYGLVVVVGEGSTAEGAPAGEAALSVVAQGVDALAAGDALAQAAVATAGGVARVVSSAVPGGVGQRGLVGIDENYWLMGRTEPGT